jgi:internalin A
MSRPLSRVAFAALAVSLVTGLTGLSSIGCDDDKESKLVAMAQIDAAKPAPAPAVATSTYDAAPPPKKTYVCAAPPGVDFHGNDALESEVRRKLGGRDGGTITQSDLKKIKSINLSQAKVDDLDPCVYPLFTSVRDLFLGPGDLDDLTAIAPLTQLVTLRASINKVRDLTPLAKMTQMDRLDLGRTPVRDLTPLAGMTALTELQIDDTEVMDLGPLAGLKSLERLSIRNTPITDISPLKGMKKLRYLYIEGTPVADTNVLSGIGGLKIVRSGKM